MTDQAKNDGQFLVFAIFESTMLAIAIVVYKQAISSKRRNEAAVVRDRTINEKSGCITHTWR